MTLHTKKSSTKKATVQASITNYFTPNSSSRTAKAPPRPSASSRSAESSKPPKQKKTEPLNATPRESKERDDGAEIPDVVSDDDADLFSNPRPIKRTRRVISDEDDLFAPVGASSGYTELFDEPGPSTPFRTPFTPGKSLRPNSFLPPSSITAWPSSPLTATDADLDPEIPTPAPRRRQLETFRDVIPSSQTQELSLASPRPSESVSPERPTTLSLPLSKALLTPDRHDSDDVIIPDSQASSPEKLSPVKLSSLQVRTPAKKEFPTTVSFNSSASSIRTGHSSSTTIQQDAFDKGSIVPSSRTFLLTMSDGPIPFPRPTVPVPDWSKSPSEEVIPSSQTQLVSPVHPRTLDGLSSRGALQATPDRNSPAVSQVRHATQETKLTGLELAVMDAIPTCTRFNATEINHLHQTSFSSEDGVPAHLPSPQVPQSGEAPRSGSASRTNGQIDKNITPLEGFRPGQVSPPSQPSVTIRRRVGPFAPTQSEESFKHPSLGGSTENPFAREEKPCLGSPVRHPLSIPIHPNTEEPTPLDNFNEPSATLGLTQPLSFVERSFPSQYTQLSEGDSFRPPTESFFDRLAAAETAESSEEEMEEGF
ncbi:hypothetical protein FS837_008158 [Tulasnella sp. UAMH 9824]|nr:hypothetical protein FS837_008158 [Tulasnella sp. UAMH 9824]